MLIIKEAGIRDIIKLKKLNTNKYNGKYSFFSEYKGNIITYVIKNKCLFIRNNEKIKGIILIRDDIKEVYFIPGSDKSISFFNLIYILKNRLKLLGYTLQINHRNLNTEIYKKYFSVDISKNIKLMHRGLKSKGNIIVPMDNKNVDICNMKIGQDELKRVYLQNKIFQDNEGRKSLTVEEVIYEENGSRFLKDLCFFLVVDDVQCGYGQIILSNNRFMLVNFGIISEYRGKGLSKYFLSSIINLCRNHGIRELYLSVDNNNIKAINLYNKLGFKEIYNEIEIIL